MLSGGCRQSARPAPPASCSSRPSSLMLSKIVSAIGKSSRCNPGLEHRQQQVGDGEPSRRRRIQPGRIRRWRGATGDGRDVAVVLQEVGDGELALVKRTLQLTPPPLFPFRAGWHTSSNSSPGAGASASRAHRSREPRPRPEPPPVRPALPAFRAPDSSQAPARPVAQARWPAVAAASGSAATAASVSDS